MGVSMTSSYYVSLFGMGIQIDHEFEFSDGVVLRPVKLDTDIEKLIEKTKSQREYGFVCALSEAVTFQLEIVGETLEEAARRGWNAQWTLILISIYVRKPIYWPLNASRNDVKDSNFKFGVGNLFWGPKIFAEPHLVSLSVLQNCAKDFKSYNGLLSDRRFTHAASVAATNHNEPKFSIRVAAIWSAIESLLGFDHELRFRISAAIARLLEIKKDSQISRFKSVRKLYDLRSKCVHGAPMSDIDQKNAASDSLDLLCELLIFFISRGAMIDKADMDYVFFGDLDQIS